MTQLIPSHTLNNGVKIPLLGFGTFAKGRKDGETYVAVTAALETGYRHFDCAWFYNNEDEIGSALHDWLSTNPAFKRSDIFITTKVWLHLSGSDDDIEWSLNDSLRQLKMEYVDCFLLHWPISVERTDNYQPKIGDDGKYIIQKERTEHPELMWSALEKLYKAGKARAIGVSNWSIPMLDILLASAEIIPAVNEFEIHPYLPNTELVEYCLEKDILPLAFSPLGSQHSLPSDIPSSNSRLTTHPTLITLASNKSKTSPFSVSTSQILISWALKRSYGVLPKSSNPSRIQNNFELVELTDKEFEIVSGIANGRLHRFCNLEHIFGIDIFNNAR